jgi:diguanylate cyclase (GGDEF)-like protein
MNNLLSPLVQDESPFTILLADDDTLLRKIVIKALEVDGYRIIEAKNGAEALDLYRQIQPDLVLLDGSMPIMNGFECCAKLRSLAPLPVLPILMITGLDNECSINAAFDAGATDYIQKPINWLVLRRRVQLLLEMTKLHGRLEEANEELKTLAYIDELTNLFNRRSLDESLEGEWQRCQQSGDPLCIIMIDVDCFKRFNDTYGHPAGDRCLQQVGHTLRSCIRWPLDIGARYGGEEFMIMLNNTNLNGGRIVAERIRKTLYDLKIPHQSSLVEDTPWVTLSLGVSCTQGKNYPSLEAFIQDADCKLYQAKKQGRNQVVI